MKNLILFLILLSSFNLFSQENKELEEMNEALNLLNDIRAFSELEPLILNHELNKLAEQRAFRKSILGDKYRSSKDGTGEGLYSQDKSVEVPVNYYNGVLGLTLKEEWITEDAYKQLKCKTCTSAGFGKAKNDEYDYIVIIYDSVE